MRSSQLLLVAVVVACTLLVADAALVSRKHHRGHHELRVVPVTLKFKFNEPGIAREMKADIASKEKVCQQSVSNADFEKAILAAYSELIGPRLETIVKDAEGTCKTQMEKWFGPKHKEIARRVLEKTVYRLTKNPTTPVITIHRWMAKDDLRPNACQDKKNIMYTGPHESWITVCSQSYVVTGGNEPSCALKSKQDIAFSLFHEFTHAAVGTDDLGYEEFEAKKTTYDEPNKKLAALEELVKVTKKFSVAENKGASANAQNYAYWFRDCYLADGAATDKTAKPAAADAAPTAAGPTGAPTAQTPTVF